MADSENVIHNAKVISFINMKGGVGKTTLAINIGYTMVEEYNKNVLLIDMDPQFNASQALMTKFRTIQEYSKLRDKNKTIASVLTSSGNSLVSNDIDNHNDNIIINLKENKGKRLDLVPGDLSLTSYESASRGSEKLLAKYLNDLKKNKTYDYVIIDTPATYSIYSQASLYASNYYIVPISPDIFSTLGYDLLQKALNNDLVLEGHDLKNLGIIFTMYNENKQKRSNIINSFSNNITFTSKLYENENIRSGSIDNFLYDMQGTKENIIDITGELLRKLGDN